MALQMRGAGWMEVHPAGHPRRWPAVLMAAGSIAMIAGLALLVATFAPMFGVGDETATVAQPAPTIEAFGPTTGAAAVLNPLNAAAAPAIVDTPVNGVAFTIRVPALNYSAKVLEGVDKTALSHGPGHYPFSSWPGRDGTVGVAAHNVYWLSFSRLKVGDQVQLQSPHGVFVYQITGSKITVAEDLSVLKSTAEHRLVLTTCYPLWAGAFATKRLVFFASEVGGLA